MLRKSCYFIIITVSKRRNWQLAPPKSCPFVISECVFAEKSRAFSPHNESKKHALGPEEMRAPSLGRLVPSPYPMSPRDIAKISHDQHLLHFNCESSSCLLWESVSLIIDKQPNGCSTHTSSLKENKHHQGWGWVGGRG